MRIHQLTERTAYHDNPRYNAVQQLKMLTKTSAGTNKYISFTKLPKLGINPNNEHSTPIGIYLYPLDYVIKTIGGADDFSYLPYASDRPYIYLVELSDSAKILNITSKNPVHDEVTKLHDYIVQHKYKNILENFKFTTITSPQSLWFGVVKLAKMISQERSGSYKTISTMLFKDVLGYDAATDDGSSTIHVNEPTQTVIFNVKAIKKYTLIDNTTADHTKNTITIKYDDSRVVHAVTPSEALRQSSGKSDVKRYEFDGSVLSVVNRDGKIIITCYTGDKTIQLLTKQEWLRHKTITKAMVRGTGIEGVKEHPRSGSIKTLLDTIQSIVGKPDVPNLFGVPIKAETSRYGNKTLANTYNNIGNYTILIKPNTAVDYTVKIKHKAKNNVATFEITRYHDENADTFKLNHSNTVVTSFEELIRLYEDS